MPGTRSSAISGKCRCSKNKIWLSVFSCCWLAFLFSLQAGHSPVAFLCCNNGDMRLFSASCICGLRQGHSASWAGYKMCFLCLWSEKPRSELNTFFTRFSQFISHSNLRVGGCVYLCLPLAQSWDLPGWMYWGAKDYFQFSVMILLETAVCVIRFGFSGGMSDCAVSWLSRCLKCTPQKALWSLRGVCHGLTEAVCLLWLWQS